MSIRWPKIIAAVSFNVFLILEFFLMSNKPLIGWLLMLLAIVNGLLYLLLRKMGSSNNPGVLSCTELKNAEKILRYAAAALSFISLLTTSNGMKTFVFGPDQEWMAYVTSFGVQAILMVFSLLLCHFYTTIGNLKDLSYTGRRLLIGGLTLFFAAAIVISSSFSYAFISENAYRKSLDSDSETIIQNRLIQETSSLENENERIGELLLTDILDNVQKGLLPAAEKYSETLEKAAKDSVTALNPIDINLRKDDLSIQPTIDGLIKRYPTHQADMRALEDQYNRSFLDALEEQVSKYNTIAKILENMTFSNPETVHSELERYKKELLLIRSDIENLGKEIDNLGNSVAIRDLEPIRTGFRTSAKSISNRIDLTTTMIDTVLQNFDIAYGESVTGSNATVAEAENSISTNNTILAQIDGLQRDILLLKAKQIAGTGSNQSGGLDDTTVSDLISRIMNLIQDLSKAGALPAESVQPLAGLSEQVEEYGKYAKLAQRLRDFRDGRLAKSYYFSGAGSVDSETWKISRGKDFHTLFSLLNSLPRRPEVYHAETKAETLTENVVEKPYDATKVLHSLSVLRRDLLGNITGLERGLNYFKYEFRKMAYFSMFVAVFLDLGTFFTGSFLYGTKYIQDFLRKWFKLNPPNREKASDKCCGESEAVNSTQDGLTSSDDRNPVLSTSSDNENRGRS